MARKKFSSLLLVLSLVSLLLSPETPLILALRPRPGFKNVSPQAIEAGALGLGKNKTFTYELNSSLTYRVYVIGPWIDPKVPEGKKTDYDIYIYNPFGAIEQNHTEAAGLPEHLGTTVDDPLFRPRHTGNYSLVIVNDRKHSNGSDAATVMVIEYLETNRWYMNKQYMEGFDRRGNPRFFTNWSYEFISNKPYIEVIIDVPETLDMYEARLFQMANPSMRIGSYLSVSGAPVPPDGFLYGSFNRTRPLDTTRVWVYGGYNLDPKGYRGNAFASCEYPGQDMKVVFNTSSTQERLYHLAFIAEAGEGYLSFIIKTDFTPPVLRDAAPFTERAEGEVAMVNVTATDADSGLRSVELSYSSDGWKTSKLVEMARAGGNNYVALIPGEVAGNRVDWRVVAFDKVNNNSTLSSSFLFRGRGSISLSTTPAETVGRSPVSVFGSISPPAEGERVNLRYSIAGLRASKNVTTDAAGRFRDTFTPQAAGDWTVSAAWSGGERYFGASYNATFKVAKAPTELSMQVKGDKIPRGEEVSVTGRINPPMGGASIKLNFEDPDAKTATLNATILSSGEFQATYKVEKEGTWRVQAVWGGDQLYQSSQSGVSTFSVQAKFELNLTTILMIAAPAAGGGATVLLLLRRRRRKRRAEEEGEEEEEFP